MNRYSYIAPAILLCTLAGVAPAHHAFNMFDNAKTLKITGTVKEYRWAMPHVFIYVSTVQNGKPVVWALEMHSPNIVARKGFSKSSVKPGDVISVTFHPMRDGSPTGSVVAVTLPDGKRLQNAESNDSA